MEPVIDPLMIASVTADEARADKILRTSPDYVSGRLKGVLAVVQPPNNITLAYNAILHEQRGQSEYIALVHDDVWLPEGWADEVIGQIALVEAMDPERACLGVAGVWYARKNDAKYFEGRMLDCGAPYPGTHSCPCRVDTLDEVCLIVRNDGETRLCERLTGHHLYGAEYCLRMARVEKWSYAIDAYLEHRKVLDETEQDNEVKRRVHDPQFYFNAGILLERYWDMLPIITNCMSLRTTVRGVEMLR